MKRFIRYLEIQFLYGEYSDVKAVKCGVPQGKCFGLLLWTIFYKLHTIK